MDEIYKHMIVFKAYVAEKGTLTKKHLKSVTYDVIFSVQ